MLAHGHHFDWETLYSRKAAQLILYGRALGLSHGEAEDILQEMFLALMRLAQLPSQPEHYLIRSFRNRALNHKRSLWRRLSREFESHRWFEKSSDENPAEKAAMKCLAELPQEQRETIVLKIWHRCTFEEIGNLLEISPNTVAGRYRYGLQKIKKQLEEASLEENFAPPHPGPLPRFAAERENVADSILTIRLAGTLAPPA